MIVPAGVLRTVKAGLGTLSMRAIDVHESPARSMALYGRAHVPAGACMQIVPMQDMGTSQRPVLERATGHEIRSIGACVAAQQAHAARPADARRFWAVDAKHARPVCYARSPAGG